MFARPNHHSFFVMRHLRLIVLWLAAMLCGVAGAAQPRGWADSLRSGDLLFVGDSTGMGQAVQESTGRYSHVAIVERRGGSLYVIDATPANGVARRPLGQLLEEGMPVDVYRLTAPFDTVAMLARAQELIGLPYDNAFLPDNGALYCSELICTVYLSRQGKPLFSTKPMNWRDADGNLPDYWVEHFRKLGMPVPEGVEGTNPADLARSSVLRYVFTLQ